MRRCEGATAGGGAGRQRAARRDGGYVTAEAALAVPALVAVLAMVLWGVAAGMVRQECADAARAGARALARGEPASDVRTLALAVAPSGARVRLSQDGELHRVRVEATSWGPNAISLSVAADAVAQVEPS
ncbi:TadE family type IV pilus minor pilin [Streptomyces sp. SM12]|uniref:TadE family type IV pilus minor pilin n=1 Tax=Streptomyces sp. SM12 TaxID=1071602 RepID=UPI000CD58B02|nr:TadE family type IV pilus minor pilin [Streptomyces sp. SM12]